MKTLSICAFGLLLLCSSLQGSNNTEDTKAWLWGIASSLIDENRINYGTLMRKGPHALLTHSVHRNRKNYEDKNTHAQVSMASIGYCYFMTTEWDIHPFLGVSIARASCSLYKQGEEITNMPQPFKYWADPSIIPCIGVHLGQNYWVSLLVQLRGSINFTRWPEQPIDAIAEVAPETLKALPSHFFSRGILVSLAFKIF